MHKRNGALLATVFFALALCACAKTPDTPPPQKDEPALDSLFVNPSLKTAVIAVDTPSVPSHWQTNAWGTASGAQFAYPVKGVDDAFAAMLSLPQTATSHKGDGAASWVPEPVHVEGGAFYSFSDDYTSNAPTFLIAKWTLSDGKDKYDAIATLEPTAPGEWQSASVMFTAPQNAVSMTMLHELEGEGELTVDAYRFAKANPPSGGLAHGIVSLTFDDGWESQYAQALPILKEAGLKATFYIITNRVGEEEYVTREQVSEILSDGNEVSSHTQTHPDLREIDPDAAQAELAQSQATLKEWGIGLSGDGIAYPYGEYNSNIKWSSNYAGYVYARTTDIGFNTADSPPYGLKSYSVVATTAFDEVKRLIDDAVENKLWLILTFHEVDAPGLLKNNGEAYGTTPEQLRQIVSYLSQLRSSGQVKVEGALDAVYDAGVLLKQ